MEQTMFESQRTRKPAGNRPNNLYTPVAHDGGERGHNWDGHTMGTSVYTEATLRPRLALLGATPAIALAGYAMQTRRPARRPYAMA